MVTQLVLGIAAFVGSVLSAILGMGGGILLLAIMLFFLDPSEAIPLHAVVQLISNATRVQAYLRHVRWQPFLVFAVAATPCVLVGMRIVDHLDKDWTLLCMAVAILYATWAPKWGIQNLNRIAAFSAAGAIVGTLGVVIGATGPLTAPFFLHQGFKKEELIGTKALCQTYGHIIKIIAFGWVGFSFRDGLPLLLPMALAVVLGTYTGRHFLRKLSDKRFFLAYKTVLSLIALRLLVQSLMDLT